MGGHKPETPARRTKDIDLAIDIEAPPESVWRALSEGEEMARWFPLEAEVVAGVGGTVTISWGPDAAGTGLIDVWEENHRLRWIEGGVEPGDAAGAEAAEAGGGLEAAEAGAGPEATQASGGLEAAEAGAGEAAVIAVDFTIEGQGGRSVLRLVHSGFSADDDWADYFDTVHSGWQYFLFNLKHYLERHHGTPRRMVWDRRKISLPKPAAWERLFAAGGLVDAAPPAAGQEGTLWSGHRAVVEMVTSPIHLACRCAELNDALLFVELEPGGDTYSLGVWLSLYGVDEARAAQLERSLKEHLDRLV